MAEARQDGPDKGWGWLRQVRSTTQQLGQMCTEGVGEAKRRLEENRPGIDQFVKNLGDNVQQGVKKVQEPGLDQLVRNFGDNVQKGVRNIHENLARDPWSSPPTAAEMASLDLVYVNERLIAMRLPVDKRLPPVPESSSASAGGKERGVASSAVRPQQDGNDIDVIAALLRSRHAGHYMVWNVSEESYDYSMFEDQVLEFRFPGHPAPPLGMLFKICTSIESWVCADDKNIAAVHCLTGRGRTSTVLACYLAWVGEFSTPNEALQEVASSRGIPMERLTIPSQRRYISYYANIMEGIRPRSEPLLLRRVIMNTIPTFGTKGGSVIGPGKGAAALAEEEAVAAGGEGENGALGCCPYLQVFKGGALIFTAAYRPSEGLAYAAGPGSGDGVGEGEEQDGEARTEALGDEFPWAYTSDDSVAFSLDCVVQGDLLIRCRHLSPDGRRVSMFRAAFHTGYVPSGVLRFTKQHLDGACADDRFHQEFFLDLIFAPVEPSTSTPTPTPPARDETPEASSSADGEAVPPPTDGDAAEDPSTVEQAEGREDKGEGEQAEETEQAVGKEGGEGTEGGATGKEESESDNSAAARRKAGIVAGTETGEAFDSMLHRDERFWKEIASRKKRRVAIVKARQAARSARAQKGGRGAKGTAADATSRARILRRKEDAAAAAVRAGGIKFSIDEDEVAQSGRAQWSDAASPSGSAPAPTAAASAASRTSGGGINDDDLLAQLVEAEMEEGGFEPPPPPRSAYPSSAPDAPARGRDESRPGDDGNSDTVIDEKAASAGEGMLSTAPESTLASKREGEEAPGHERGAQYKSALGKEPGSSSAATVAGGAGSGEISGKGSNPPPSASGPSLEDELTQLEELERELGIVGFSGAAGGAGGVDGADSGKGKGTGAGSKSSVGDAGKDDSFDMENLDELEGYLESLAK